MNDDKIVMIPLIAKEIDDRKHFKIIILLIFALIITNISWASTWLLCTHAHDTIDTRIEQESGEDSQLSTGYERKEEISEGEIKVDNDKRRVG